MTKQEFLDYRNSEKFKNLSEEEKTQAIGNELVFDIMHALNGLSCIFDFPFQLQYIKTKE